MNAFFALLGRDLRLSFRSGGGAGLGLAFFAISAMLVPFGVGSEPERLAPIAPGMVWSAALLACLLTLERMFQADLEDGSLDHIALSPLPLEAVVLAKALAHWLVAGLPLALISPLIGLSLHLPGPAYGPLALSLLVGGPGLSLIGSMAAALTAGLKRGGVLTAVLVLPLYIPTLIFGALAARAAVEGIDPAPYLMICGAISLGSLALAPFASAAALRLALS